jgi:hypothetical protein
VESKKGARDNANLCWENSLTGHAWSKRWVKERLDRETSAHIHIFSFLEPKWSRILNQFFLTPTNSGLQSPKNQKEQLPFIFSVAFFPIGMAGWENSRERAAGLLGV